MTEKGNSSPDTWLQDHGDYLYRYAYVRLGNKAAAEDVLQDCFLAAIKGYDRFDGRVDVKYWLLGILKHKVVDHIRKASREVAVEDIEGVSREEEFRLNAFGITTTKPTPWQFDPRKAFEREEVRAALALCISKLKGTMHQVFTLRELEGWSTDDICKELNLNPNNLWVIIHRARAQLKTCLEKNWKHIDEKA